MAEFAHEFPIEFERVANGWQRKMMLPYSPGSFFQSSTI